MAGLPGQARIRIRDGAIASHWFDYLFVSLADLRAILANTPWQQCEGDEHEASYAVHLVYRP